jgi:hypothetical protein
MAPNIPQKADNAIFFINPILYPLFFSLSVRKVYKPNLTDE